MSEERVYSDVTEEVATEEVVAEEFVTEEPVVETPVATQAPVAAKTGLATAALVFGILAFITTLFLLNYVFGILALIFGIIYLVKKADVKPKGKAITGVVLASLSIIISTTLWVSLFVYITKTDITDIIEDVAALTGQEIDGREVVNKAITDAIGGEVMIGDKPLNLDTIEAFVGGEVSVDRVLDFVGDVKPQDIESFAAEVSTMEPEKLQAIVEDFQGEITYEKLEEKLGEEFTLESLMDYIRDFEGVPQEMLPESTEE